MARLLPVAASVLALMWGVSAIAAKPESESEKISYTIGYDLGKSTHMSGVELESGFVLSGMKAGASDGEPELTEEEMAETLEVFKKKLIEKVMKERESLAQNNADASKQFLDDVAKKEGVSEIEPGLYYEVLTAGKGAKPAESDKVEVHYRGELIDGTEFDSTYSRDETASFRLDQVIPGWTTALQQMPTGSKWKIYISPELAYGEFAPPMIGPNQALTFTVELLDIQQADASE